VSDVLVLAYHAVSREWDWRFSVAPEQLEQHLRFVLGRGYRAVTFAEAAGGNAGRFVAVTFDDAFLSAFEHGFPILEQLRVPATMFAVTDYAGTDRLLAFGHRTEDIGGPRESELRGMSWEQLEQLAAAGWEIGSHTRTHPSLTSLSDADLADELRGSKQVLEERLGRPCVSLAFPFGDTDDRVRRAAAEAGYVAAADFPPRFVRAGPFSWPRVGIYRDDDGRRFARKVSPVLRRVRASGTAQRALGLARSAR
jgi:peptidoglycan/xylan/chitin deacetylase (PgdA/CDA1 family)